MRVLLLTLLAGLFAASVQAEAKDCVVLLHGMARSAGSMTPLESYLKAKGYRTMSLGYASRSSDIDKIVTEIGPVIGQFSQMCEGRLHFVTHSMGGIVTRAYLHASKPANLGNVVMLAPPNQGSEVADFLLKNPMYVKISGPAGQRLGAQNDAAFNQMLGKVDYPLGIIAGDRSVNLISSWFLLPGADDGKVTVERARLEGMSDFIVLHTSHPTMLFSNPVKRQVGAFLKNGAFEHTDSASAK